MTRAVILVLVALLAVYLFWRLRPLNLNNKSLSILKTSRKFHKWIMLFVGMQFVIWSISGAYMVILDIDYIHGDSLVRNSQNSINHNNINLSLRELFKRYPNAKNIEVGRFIEQDVYRFVQSDDKYLLSAQTGEQLSPLTEKLAVKAAQHHYTGDDKVVAVTLITENPPFELSPRHLPAWRINFAAFGSPSIYISAQSGELVGKRHEFWRTFDLMFRLHVMDYETGENIDNLLLFWVTIFGLIACITGLILAYLRVFKSNTSRGMA